jgi:hypothetical protein
MYVCMNELMNEWMNEWRTYVMNNMEKWGALTRFQQKK